MNEQLKPFKTVEAIAKRHRLEVSFIQKELDMGEQWDGSASWAVGV